MNIQEIKSNTTWQEASNTINNNNNKISLAIATLENTRLKNKGYFTSVEKLNEAIPNPTIGSKAYVGTSEPYAIYIVENGVWVDSGYTGGDEIVAKITTDRIENGAVTSEKIATSAFDSTLSVSGKIAPADVVGKKITDLEQEVKDTYGDYVENPEWVKVVTDEEGKILYGIKTDGNLYFGYGCPPQVKDYIEEKISSLSLDEYEDIVAFLSDYLGGDATLKSIIDNIANTKVDKVTGKSLIDEEFAKGVSQIENPEFIEVKTDSEGNLLAGRTTDGTAFEKVGFSTPKVYIDGHTIENIEDYEGRSEIITDAKGKIISYRDSEGVKHEEVGIDTVFKLSYKNKISLYHQLKSDNYNFMDWSDENNINLPIPTCAKFNIICSTGWPNTKYQNTKAQIEYYDMKGNYFKKWIILNAQGASSLANPKKNISIDLFSSESDVNAELIGEDSETSNIRFGNWASFDSFHIKAYYGEFFKGINACIYTLYDEIVQTRGFMEDYMWKKALIDSSVISPNLDIDHNDVGNIKYDTGAKGFPVGFPCVGYLNGEFYGLFSWQIKKTRSNYRLSKDNPKHIHLDIFRTEEYFWNNCETNWEAVDYETYVSQAVIWELGHAPYPFNTIVKISGDNLHCYKVINPNGAKGYPKIGWEYIEIRNPKNLVYKTPLISIDDGSDIYAYDADNNRGNGQSEIVGDETAVPYVSGTSYGKNAVVFLDIDGSKHYFISSKENNIDIPTITSKNTDKKPNFKASWINCTNTVKVKNYILSLRTNYNTIKNEYKNYLNSEKTESDLQALKTVFETYFDADNLTDYNILIDVVGVTDSTINNLQWYTYNGVKWYGGAYDLDRAFGYGGNVFNNHIASLSADYNNSPLSLFVKLYDTDLKERYKYLSDRGIISVENIFGYVKKWMDAFGSDFYEKEADKWPQGPGLGTVQDNVYRIYKFIEEEIRSMDSNVYNYIRN